MEDIVAIKVTSSREAGAFLTWGRIFDTIHPSELLEIIEKNLNRYAFDREASVNLYLCDTLQEVSHFPYFYEAFFKLTQEKIPFGPGYQKWREEKQKALREGKNIYYLGSIRN